MLKLLIAAILLFSGCNVIESDTNGTEVSAPILQDIPVFGNPNQVEIVTWNIEHFPKRGDLTRAYLATIIDQFDIDVYVLQEIESISEMQALVDVIPDYQFIKAEQNNQLNLVLLYNSKTISVTSVAALWSGSSNLHFFAQRPPLRVDFTWNNGTIEVPLTIINLHLKCCGNGIIDLGNNDDEEFRRLKACQLLHDYVLDSLKNKNVIIAGDWNDELQEPAEQNVFWPLIADSTNFTFVDMNIAIGNNSGWSWPGWNSSYSAAHFDHLMINEYLFDEMKSGESRIQTIHVEDLFKNGADDYDSYISDHRPLLWRFSPLQ